VGGGRLGGGGGGPPRWGVGAGGGERGGPREHSRRRRFGSISHPGRRPSGGHVAGPGVPHVDARGAHGGEAPGEERWRLRTAPGNHGGGGFLPLGVIALCLGICLCVLI